MFGPQLVDIVLGLFLCSKAGLAVPTAADAHVYLIADIFTRLWVRSRVRFAICVLNSLDRHRRLFRTEDHSARRCLAR
jgi:hypothetical protein